MDIQDFKEKLFKVAKEAGFTNCEIYFMRSTAFEVHIFKGEIAQYKDSAPMGLSFRGIYDGKMGYAYSERIDDSVIDLIIKNAKENGMIIEQGYEILFKGDDSYSEVPAVSPLLNKVSVEEKINMAKEIERIALEADDRIKSVDYAVVASGETQIHVANSYGVSLSQSLGYGIASITARAEEDGKVKVGNHTWGGRDFESFEAGVISKKAVTRAVDQLGATSIKSGDYKIVLENKMAVSILSTFIVAFFAETVQKGFSLLRDRVGEKIASDIVTIRDDISHPESLQSLSFDSEGVATFNKVVVENGVLKTYLYNLKAADREKRKSTGNGFKSSFKSAVETACINFYVEPTDTGLDDMLNKMGDGIFITNLAGLHSGTNSVSGDFSLLAEGFLVENGEIVRPVDQITIAGNFYDLLKNIDAVADDLYFSLSGETIGSPSLLISKITVSGL